MLEILSNILYVAVAVLALLFMVTVHELGHYLAGKLLGFDVTEFSVGFGPAIFSRKKNGETFSVRVLPLGGYCAFFGEDEESEKALEKERERQKDTFESVYGGAGDAENAENVSLSSAVSRERRPFNGMPAWKRLIVLLSGVAANFLVSVIITVLLFSAGGFSMVEIREMLPSADGTQITGDLRSGDVIYELDGKFLSFPSYDLSKIIAEKGEGATVPVVVLRKNEDGEYEKVNTHILIRAYLAETQNEDGMAETVIKTGIGARTATVRHRLGFFESAWRGISLVFEFCFICLETLWQLVTFRLPLSSVGGPVATIAGTAEAAKNGAFSYFFIVAMMGLNLAVFNVLPFPSLDGSRVLFCLIEMIRKKPIPRKVEAAVHLAGIAILFAFVIFVDFFNAFV